LQKGKYKNQAPCGLFRKVHKKMQNVMRKNHQNSVDILDDIVYTVIEVILMMNYTETTRYTATLPVAALNDLKALAGENLIPSVNYGIRQAVDEYLKQIKKAQYAAQMKKAAADEAFIERTSRCAEDFSLSDSEVQGEW